jgi:hypothetical protein
MKNYCDWYFALSCCFFLESATSHGKKIVRIASNNGYCSTQFHQQFLQGDTPMTKTSQFIRNQKSYHHDASTADDSSRSTTSNDVGDHPLLETMQVVQMDRWNATQQKQRVQKYTGKFDNQGMVLTEWGRGIWFYFVLMRNIYFFALNCHISVSTTPIDLFLGGLLRAQIICLIVLNGLGFVLSAVPSSRHTKYRLKSIVHLQALVEIVLVCWCILRLVTPNDVSRKDLIVSIAVSSFFILECVCFDVLWGCEPIQPAEQDEIGIVTLKND